MRTAGQLIVTMAAVALMGCNGGAPTRSTVERPEAPQAVAVRVDPPASAIRARYGQAFDTDEISGWSDLGGGMIFWGERYDLDTGVSVHAAPGRMMLLSSSMIARTPDGAARWRLADGAVFPARDGDYLAYSCKLSLHGAYTPGLIGVVREGPFVAEDGETALIGPAVVAFHIDPANGRMTREERPVYCEYEGYGA